MSSNRKIIFTDSALPPLPVYSQGIVANGFLFCSGSIGVDLRTRKLVTGVQAQTRAALQNMVAILNAAGSTIEDVVKINIYLTDLKNDFAPMNEAYIEFVGNSPPARTCVGVAELPLGAVVEIECTAIARQ